MNKFNLPYRVGKKQKRAVLDCEGKEVVVFSGGREKEAQEYCDFLNSKEQSNKDIWKEIKEFIDTNYSFFTEDTRSKMKLGINEFIKNYNISKK
jgi:hypothetical protein